MASTRRSLQLVMVPLQAAVVRQRIRTLTLQAEEARSLRALDKVNAIADTLLAIAPLHLQPLGTYYRAISLNRSGRGTPQSTAIFEALTGSPLAVLRGRAELALGTQAYLRGDHSLADGHYQTAQKHFDVVANDPIGAIHLRKMRAILRGAGGLHETALFELQQTWRLAKTIHANYGTEVYCILNSMSTELIAIGHANEALPLVNVALASPYAVNFPEWAETKAEIERAIYRPSTVNMPSLPRTVLDFCARRQAKAEKANYDRRCAQADRIIQGSINRIVAKKDGTTTWPDDLADQKVDRILKILSA